MRLPWSVEARIARLKEERRQVLLAREQENARHARTLARLNGRLTTISDEVDELEAFLAFQGATP